jgi:hypothetical protein
MHTTEAAMERWAPTGFTCPRCGRTSHHPDDAREGYCGACHDWTGLSEGQRGALDQARATREHMARWAAGADTHRGEAPS